VYTLVWFTWKPVNVIKPFLSQLVLSAGWTDSLFLINCPIVSLIPCKVLKLWCPVSYWLLSPLFLVLAVWVVMAWHRTFIKTETKWVQRSVLLNADLDICATATEDHFHFCSFVGYFTQVMNLFWCSLLLVGHGPNTKRNC